MHFLHSIIFVPNVSIWCTNFRVFLSLKCHSISFLTKNKNHEHTFQYIYVLCLDLQSSSSFDLAAVHEIWNHKKVLTEWWICKHSLHSESIGERVEHLINKAANLGLSALQRTCHSFFKEVFQCERCNASTTLSPKLSVFIVHYKMPSLIQYFLGINSRFQNKLT